ncbi:MAG: hypothetical protein ACJAQT_003781 [Akkermansiaceae bacterium]|jgi:hypothetical protein
MRNFFLILAAGTAFTASGETVGLWRFDDAGAVNDASVSMSVNDASPGALDASLGGGNPLYSDDVPAAEIFDPVSGTTYTNQFSLDASTGGSQFNVEDSLNFNSSFTVEFFVKYIGEPASYEGIFQRLESPELSWKMDFDHGANAAFGRIRARWDTPGGVPDGIAEAGVDENVNFVVGPQGNATAPKVYIDTGAKDAAGAEVGPQNTGNTNDYVYDIASENPNDTDVALQGDGVNDVDEWHHVAMSLDQDTGEVKFYFDYLLSQTRTLSDAEADGYTHPAAGLAFGKLTGSEYGLLMDEVRYSSAILSPGDFLREPIEGAGNTIGHWRLEEDGAVDGGDVIVAENAVGPTNSAQSGGGIPKYSTDVPSPTIFDPITNTTLANQFSLDATEPSSRLRVADDASFNSSFTFEFFIKMIGEPSGYHAFVRRSEAGDLRWQFDFDHAAVNAFGRLRTRFDTPGTGGPDGVNEAGVDENINFVLGPTGGVNIPDALRLWIDTDLGDGMAASYDDPTDWARDGDGVNDVATWHHAAITFDEETGEIGFYYDYELMQLRTLSDSEGDGYTHPAAPIDFGKLTNGDYGLLLDEIRYSGDVLLPFQFLQSVTPPIVDLEITSVVYDAAIPQATVTWSTVPGQKYSLDYSADLFTWIELLEEEEATGETETFIDTNLQGGSPKIFYRVREIQ